jgi:DHA1 family multidrug resistance protein-like MFS transporter
MSLELPLVARNFEQQNESNTGVSTNSIDSDRRSNFGKCPSRERVRDSHAPTLADVDSGTYSRNGRCSQCGHLSSARNSDLAPGDEKTELREEKSYLVEFDGPDDPDNPKNFSNTRKVLIVALTSSCTFCVSFASSIFSTCTEVTAAEFGVSQEVMILGVSLFVLGFAIGEASL